MSKIVYANKLQMEVLKSSSRVTVITAHPGAGSTTALILKAVQACNERRINCSLFITSTVVAKAPGGVVEQVFKYLDTTARFSDKSLIFTFCNDSKLKLVPCDSVLESTMGLSRDLMLFDSSIKDSFIVHHLPRAYESVVVDSVCEIEKEDSWANQLYLLDRKDDKILGFCSGVNHITGKLEDNFLFEEREKYQELVEAHIPEKMRIEF